MAESRLCQIDFRPDLCIFSGRRLGENTGKTESANSFNVPIWKECRDNPEIFEISAAFQCAKPSLEAGSQSRQLTYITSQMGSYHNFLILLNYLHGPASVKFGAVTMP